MDMTRRTVMRSSATHQTGVAMDEGEEAEAVDEQIEEAGTAVGVGAELGTRF